MAGMNATATAQTSLLVPVLTGIFALVGAYLGGLLNRTNEHKQWLRNEKVVAYREYLELMSIAMARNFLHFTDARPDDEPVDAVDKYLERFERIYSASFRVVTIAPQPIADQVYEALDRLAQLKGWFESLPDTLSQKHLNPDDSEEERRAKLEDLQSDAMTELERGFDEFIAYSVAHANTIGTMMRADLKVRDRLPGERRERLTSKLPSLRPKKSDGTPEEAE